MFCGRNMILPKLVHNAVNLIDCLLLILDCRKLNNTADVNTLCMITNFFRPVILGGFRGQLLELEPPSISILCDRR